MEMTPLQLASEYRTGKDKTKTIKVLAELNAVTQRRIAEILQEQGEELPGHWQAKLELPLQRPPRKPRPATQKELAAAIVEAVTPETGRSFADAQDDGGKGAALSADSDPASRTGRISWAQYSRLAQLLGRLDGVGVSLAEPVAIYYYDTLDLLYKLADEIRPLSDV